MRNVRRKDREIIAQEAVDVLNAAEFGVLSTVDPEGQPYGVPLSFVYNNDAIYFHCALNGHKLDNIALNSKVSFCAVGGTHVLPDKFATEYESAIVFGIAGEAHGTERYEALVCLLQKYCSDYLQEGLQYIELKDSSTKVLKIEINYISGKARRKI